jgi:hypothetical protein
MLVYAHAGHWLVQLIYLVPLAVLVAVILIGRARDRREEARKKGGETRGDGAGGAGVKAPEGPV